MKKVLFAINTLNNGGAEKVLLTLLRYLDPKKYEIHLLVVFGEGIYFEQIPQYVRVTHIFPCKVKKQQKKYESMQLSYMTICKRILRCYGRVPGRTVHEDSTYCNDPMCRNMRGCIRT